ncbi:btb (poz) domain-containing 2a-related [Anaeramoeba ignava]|uniref:Btb (Poz) domain-containing 2a-related n=1 Tax=Anaeramoeba ignava TaxID=1746090 RepID=A0A9Q0LH58_ANAIG|nr:btb (poz) domain-containing 2a-related [Anaeramoeba ignava]
MENEMYIYPLQIPRFCQEMLDVLRGCVVADFNIVSADNVVFQVHKSIILTRIRRYGTISKMNLMSNISNEVILQGNTQENSQNNNLYFDNEDQQLNSFCNLMRRYRYSTVYSLLQYFYSGLMIGIDGAVAHEFEEIATLLKFDRLLKSVQSQSFGEIHLEELVEDLRFMLENERFTDFTVMLHNENSNQKIPIKTHKVILAARSELYRGMLTSVVDQSNSAPDLSGRQLGALLTLFLYLYTDKLNINSIEDALQLFGAYSYYGLSDSLFDRKICAYLYHNLNIDNAIQICEGLLPHWNLIPAVREFGNTILRFIHENPVLIPSWELLVQKYSFLSQEAFDLSQEVFPESIDYYNKVNLNKDENKMLQNHDNSDDSSNDSDDDVGGGDW